jgi:hypothetical protein
LPASATSGVCRADKRRAKHAILGHQVQLYDRTHRHQLAHNHIRMFLHAGLHELAQGGDCGKQVYVLTFEFFDIHAPLRMAWLIPKASIGRKGTG